MNVLAVGAHFDDIELGCSGTLMKHVQGGDKVYLIVICNSAYSNPDGDVVRELDTAFMEGKNAVAIIGAELICLDYDTFMIPFGEELTGTINRYIEKFNIDIIYCPWVHDLHRDHYYAAKNTLMAGRHIPRFLMYRCNYYDTEKPFQGNFYSDITDTMDKKIEVIKAHESELERVRYKWLDFFQNQNANDGQKIGVKYAECFEVVRYLSDY